MIFVVGFVPKLKVPIMTPPLLLSCHVHSVFRLYFSSQPQNILLTSLSPPGDIKIVDFGLARRLGAVGELREILGTPEYVGKVTFIKSTLIKKTPDKSRHHQHNHLKVCNS